MFAPGRPSTGAYGAIVEMNKQVMCNSIIGISDAGLRRVIRELLNATKVQIIDTLSNAEAVIFAFRSNPQIDLIITESNLPSGGALAIAKFVRWDKSSPNPILPLTAIGQGWTPESLNEIRDAGICEVIAMPTSLKAVQKKIYSALDGKRQFISIEDYRGRCRRRRTASGYQGPFRRAADRIAEQVSTAQEKASRRAKLIERLSDNSQSQKTSELPFRNEINESSAHVVESRDSSDHESVAFQTRTVIGKALTTANEIKFISQKTDDQSSGIIINTQKQHASLMCCAQNRLINLMLLAESRVLLYGCDPDLLTSLEEIKILTSLSAKSLLKLQLQKIIDLGRSIVIGRHGVPFGIIVSLQIQVERANILVTAAGGTDNLDSQIKQLLKDASEIIKDISNLEDIDSHLPEFASL